MASSTIALACIFFASAIASASARKVLQDGWSDGRATFYGDAAGGGSLDVGSCLYGTIDPYSGTGLNVAALSDTNFDFQNSCGTCYEVMCRPAEITDGYGETLDRSDACINPGATVTVRITDACPCYQADNVYSNQRWCCGDQWHMDLSYVAFQQLADESQGVIGISWRQVSCP